MKNKRLIYLILNILFVIPSIIYLIQNKTVFGFETYFNYFLNQNISKVISSTIYLILFVAISIIYLKIIKHDDMFRDIKELLIYVLIIAGTFIMMLPWTSSDIFYYMGVGELESQYKQNPYYISMADYNAQNEENIDDEIFEQGVKNVWSNTTVVYGPFAQFIFKICTSISFKNIDVCLLIFKFINLIIHIVNCYYVYKISNKKFATIYGLNPLVLIESIGNVHNDIIIVFFILLAIYFVIKKRNIVLSVIFLALATGIKYFAILMLPVVIIYYFKNEKSLIKVLKCVQYGILFCIIVMLEYAIYFRDFRVLFAGFIQNSKYSKSILLVLLSINEELMLVIKCIALYGFAIYYYKFCVDLIVQTTDIEFYKIVRKYNIVLIFFLLLLTNFQQWYLIWIFATLMWQKSTIIQKTIGLTIISEIANSIYMFKSEWYIYDIYFVLIIVCMFIIGNKIYWRKEEIK